MPTNQITVELSPEQAEALSQFVKRVRHDICRELASSDEESFAMLESMDAIRAALAEKGYAPR
jgi:hypothetical protein